MRPLVCYRQDNGFHCSAVTDFHVLFFVVVCVALFFLFVWRCFSCLCGVVLVVVTQGSLCRTAPTVPPTVGMQCYCCSHTEWGQLQKATAARPSVSPPCGLPDVDVIGQNCSPWSIGHTMDLEVSPDRKQAKQTAAHKEMMIISNTGGVVPGEI